MREVKLELNNLLYQISHSTNLADFFDNQLKLNNQTAINYMITIPALRDSDGKISHTPKEVNCLSRDFIESLYSPQTEASNFKIEASLNTLDRPKIINIYIMVIYSPVSMAGLRTPLCMCSIRLLVDQMVSRLNSAKNCWQCFHRLPTNS